MSRGREKEEKGGRRREKEAEGGKGGGLGRGRAAGHDSSEDMCNSRNLS